MSLGCELLVQETLYKGVFYIQISNTIWCFPCTVFPHTVNLNRFLFSQNMLKYLDKISKLLHKTMQYTFPIVCFSTIPYIFAILFHN